MTMVEDMDLWHSHKNDPYPEGARIEVLVDHNPHPEFWADRRKAFELYCAFPLVADYIKAIEVLTNAGLIDRHKHRPAGNALQDIHWNEDAKHIRVVS